MNIWAVTWLLYFYCTDITWLHFNVFFTPLISNQLCLFMLFTPQLLFEAQPLFEHWITVYSIFTDDLCMLCWIYNAHSYSHQVAGCSFILMQSEMLKAAQWLNRERMNSMDYLVFFILLVPSSCMRNIL